jgi:hypothetical protein
MAPEGIAQEELATHETSKQVSGCDMSHWVTASYYINMKYNITYTWFPIAFMVGLCKDTYVIM